MITYATYIIHMLTNTQHTSIRNVCTQYICTYTHTHVHTHIYTTYAHNTHTYICVCISTHSPYNTYSMYTLFPVSPLQHTHVHIPLPCLHTTHQGHMVLLQSKRKQKLKVTLVDCMLSGKQQGPRTPHPSLTMFTSCKAMLVIDRL